MKTENHFTAKFALQVFLVKVNSTDTTNVFMKKLRLSRVKYVLHRTDMVAISKSTFKVSMKIKEQLSVKFAAQNLSVKLVSSSILKEFMKN
jgi:hypothetical protein